MRPILALTLLAAAGLAHPAVAQPQRSAAVPQLVQAEASQEAIIRLADRLRQLEADGLDPRWYDVPPASLAQTDSAAFRQATLRAAQAALTDLRSRRP